MLRFGVRPPFTLFQQLILWLLKVAPSQLNPNAWLMLIDFESLCKCGKELQLNSFSFFFLTYSLQSGTNARHIYFAQMSNVTHDFEKKCLFLTVGGKTHSSK